MSKPEQLAQRIQRRLGELRTLAEHPNTPPHEAYAALGKIQELMGQYATLLAQAPPPSTGEAPVDPVVDVTTDLTETHPAHLAALLRTLAEHWGGAVYFRREEPDAPRRLHLLILTSRKAAVLTAWTFAAQMATTAYLWRTEQEGLPFTAQGLRDFGLGFAVGLERYFRERQDQAWAIALRQRPPAIDAALAAMAPHVGRPYRVQEPLLFQQGVDDGRAMGYAPPDGLPRPSLPEEASR